MSMTGHVSEKQKNRYTHFDTTKFSEVVAAQKKLLGGGAAANEQLAMSNGAAMPPMSS
jgi:hypothetical protein